MSEEVKEEIVLPVSLETRIQNTINDVLDSDLIQGAIEQSVKKGIESAVNDLFSYSGEVRKAVKKRVEEISVPIIDRHDFGQFSDKLEIVLTDIAEEVLGDHKKLMENFADIVKPMNVDVMNIHDIFKAWKEVLADELDTSDGLEVCYDGSDIDDLSYELVDVQMRLEPEDNGRNFIRTSYEEMTVRMTCDLTDSYDVEFTLVKWKFNDNWYISGPRSSADIAKLKVMNKFELLLTKLTNLHIDVFVPKADWYQTFSDEVQPNKKPECEVR